jgi:2-amino-4-hydroxy-6-hydroxymethyldihydropteridine diphosphokinase
LGHRAENILQAIELLEHNSAIHSVRCSSFFETSPVGGPADQPIFLNAAAQLDTSLAPIPLLKVLQEIELKLGRTRHQRWDKRTLDLDILLFGQQKIENEQLTIPHPRMAFRRFVLSPLAEIAGDLLHPQLNWTIAEILRHLDNSAPYIALTGAPGAGKTTIVEALAKPAAPFAALVEDLEQIDLSEYYDDPIQAGWKTELRFLEHRTRLVREGTVAVSAKNNYLLTDFWIDQSLASAQLWLPSESQTELAELIDRSQENIIAPRLIAFVSAPVSHLKSRILQRGRSFEASLDDLWLLEWQKSLQSLVETRVRAPVLRLDGTDLEWACKELVAASQAME